MVYIVNDIDKRQYAYHGELIRKVSKAEIIKDFEKKARWYACFLRKHLPAKKDVPILDVPCGHGNFLYFLRRQGYTNIIGIELDLRRVAIAQDLGLPAKQADALKYLSHERDFELIVSLDFVEHIDKEHVPSLIASYYQALRSGGILIIRSPITDSLLCANDLYNDITHKWAGNYKILESLLVQQGFTNVIFKDERPVPYKLINWIRLGVFYFAKSITNLWLVLLGFPPRSVWSTSGWYFARKP